LLLEPAEESGGHSRPSDFRQKDNAEPWRTIRTVPA
jgi:hypothetical protein